MADGWYTAAVAGVGLVAGATASVVGFGIGSLLTPVLALALGTKLAVAAVAIPHAAGTFLRYWMLRDRVDRRVLSGFGLMSATGGLGGSLLHGAMSGDALRQIFGSLLLFAGITGLSGLAERLHFGGRSAWVAGGLSGLFGGLVGNQGGIRSASLLGFDLSKTAFVATATAVALLVDAARLPVYLFTSGPDLAREAALIAVATVAVVTGTVAGTPVLRLVPEPVFRRVVSAVVLALGVYMLWP